MSGTEEPEVDPAAEIRKYTLFLERLQADLAIANASLSEKQRALDASHALLRDIADLRREGKRELQALKDVGAGVHLHAHVPDTSHVYLAVGLGFYAEASLEEAPAVLQGRLAAQEAAVQAAEAAVASVQAHIQLITEGLEGLRRLGAAPP